MTATETAQAAPVVLAGIGHDFPGEPIDNRNEGFSPELVVRGSTAPRHTAPSGRGAGAGGRRKPAT